MSRVYNQCDGDWDYAYYIINDELNFGIKRRFWTNVTPLPDPIVCDLVSAGVTPMSDGTFSVANSCRKATATCHLPEFLAEKRTELHVIAEYLSAHSQSIKQQARVEQHLTKVLDDPRAVLGQSTCWPLGDIIIALQVPGDATLWTRDPDFMPLAEALGLRLYQE